MGIRLESALKLLPECEVIADIGCDHGKLAVFLIENGYAKRVIATDISAPSLDKARSFSKIRGLNDKIDLRLGDGFGVLAENEVDCAIVAGMGGELIASLLRNYENIARNIKTIIVQPMQNIEVLRRFLRENGWKIDEEIICLEGRRIYEWIRIISPKVYAEEEQDISLEWIDFLGPRLWERKDPLLAEKLQRKERLLRTQIDKVSRADSKNAMMTLSSMKQMLSEAVKLMKELEKAEEQESET